MLSLNFHVKVPTLLFSCEHNLLHLTKKNLLKRNELDFCLRPDFSNISNREILVASRFPIKSFPRTSYVPENDFGVSRI